jgi:WD40 repeat protein
MDTLLWNTERGAVGATLWRFENRPVRPPLYELAFTPNGRLLIGVGESAEVRVWDMSRPQQQPQALPGHLETVRTVAVSPDGRTLATGDRNGAIKLWSLELRDGRLPGQELLTLREDHGSVLNLEFSPDRNILATAYGDGTVRLWRAQPQQH